MNIVVYGTAGDFQEFRDKFGDGHHYFTGFGVAIPADNHDQTIAFVFNTDGLLPSEIFRLERLEAVFVDATAITVADILRKNPAAQKLPVYGFTGMPGFLNRPIFELSKPEGADDALLEKICGDLKTTYQIVKDQVGMVTPRIICMIINEAYYAVSEHTASRDDIDKAMKSGTNYPWGPFEWSKRIGLTHVYHLLVALQNNGGERYQICKLLKEEYLLEQQRNFLH